MIKTKSDYYYYLDLDKKRNGVTLKSRIRDFIKGGGVYTYLKTLRKLEYAINNKKHLSILFRKIMHGKHVIKFGVDISPNVFGPGIRIEHLRGIFVNSKAKIGANCSIHQFTTIGNDGFGDEAAIIGDCCYIGANVSIIGPIKIGNNVIIGAGAVVTRDFPDNVIIGGVPAKILKYKETE